MTGVSESSQQSSSLKDEGYSDNVQGHLDKPNTTPREHKIFITAILCSIRHFKFKVIAEENYFIVHNFD
ncbi:MULTISPECIES: hypothetical protein [Photorhabdus]|uniref:hypothetical protein n=1 Tax=Photorhabdus TaxID=29487 RepID=UPI0011C43FBC|nr:hypothetical protein [Photorhabdus asymbiotica]